MRLAALECRIDADLRLGRHAALVGELEALVAAPSDARALRRAAHARAVSLRPPDRRARRLPAHARDACSRSSGSSPGRGCGRCRARCSCKRRRSSSTRGRRDAGGCLDARRPARAPGRRARAATATRARSIDLLRRDGRAAGHRHGPGRRGQDDARDRGRPPAGRRVRRRRGVRQPRGARRSRTPSRTPCCTRWVARRSPAYREGHALPARGLPRAAARARQPRAAARRGGRCWSSCSTSAPRLKLLATSRAALDLRAEHRYSPQPARPARLQPPGDRDRRARDGAVHRARRRARSGVPADRRRTPRRSRRCARASTACRWRSSWRPRAPARSRRRRSRSRLDSVLTDLGAGARDAPDRHRTMRATLDWSYGLLVRSAACRVRRAQRVRRRLHDRRGLAT